MINSVAFIQLLIFDIFIIILINILLFKTKIRNIMIGWRRQSITFLFAEYSYKIL